MIRTRKVAQVLQAGGSSMKFGPDLGRCLDRSAVHIWRFRLGSRTRGRREQPTGLLG